MDKENRIRRRPRSDTAVRRLTPEQRAKVDGWLFGEHLPYREAVAGLQANQTLRATITRGRFEFDVATACLVHQVKVPSQAQNRIP